MMEFEGFARGWFVVAWSTDLGDKGVRPLSYFGGDQVLFRTEEGEAKLLDAHCPHLGAHLGHGGRVEGNSIRCPFHAWEFGGNGKCTKIPYSERPVPKKARLKPWHVVEKNGAIFAWHDPEGGEPDWEVPLIEEHGDPAWTPWYENILEGIRTKPTEIVENVADSAHFPTVHRTDVETFENFYEDHKATQHTVGTATPPRGGRDSFDIWATYYGPAFQFSNMKGVLHSRLLLAHTPIDEDHLDLRFAVMLERAGPRSEEFAQFYAENLRMGFHEDIAIWENKVIRAVPQLVDGDGPILKLRKWYKQFFQPRAA